ncbi:hypothetical protein MHYP_G00174070 [Metynnis hypsauchen]
MRFCCFCPAWKSVLLPGLQAESLSLATVLRNDVSLSPSLPAPFPKPQGFSSLLTLAHPEYVQQTSEDTGQRSFRLAKVSGTGTHPICAALLDLASPAAALPCKCINSLLEMAGLELRSMRWDLI